MSSPAHIEIVLCKPTEPVKKADTEKPKLTRKQQARKRVTAGGGSA